MENIEDEMVDVNQQFTDFLKTKGIKARFKLAFSNMKDNAAVQHQESVREFKEIKKESRENNKEFVEFLETKGLKAKFYVVVNGFKNGIKEVKSIDKDSDLEEETVECNSTDCKATELSTEFNNFLKMQGLDTKYQVQIIEK